MGGGKKTGTVGTDVGSRRSGVGANWVLISATWARCVAEICGLVRVGMGVRRVGSRVGGEAVSVSGWVALGGSGRRGAGAGQGQGRATGTEWPRVSGVSTGNPLAKR